MRTRKGPKKLTYTVPVLEIICVKVKKKMRISLLIHHMVKLQETWYVELCGSNLMLR